MLERVGVEPSGDPFNAIEFDERNHRPYNPMVNAGAMVTTDLVAARPRTTSSSASSRCSGCTRATSAWRWTRGRCDAERRRADRNRATAYLMRSQDMVDGDVEAILDLYLQQCSVQVTCRDLAVMAATLANGGVNP